MSLPYGSNEAQAAQFAAEDLLAKLNAIAHIIHGNHQNVELAGIGLKDPNGGPLQQFILGVGLGVGGIRSRARVSAVGVASGESEGIPMAIELIGDKVLEDGDRNE